MNISATVNVVTMQRHMCYIGIPMNVFGIMNVTTMQRCMYYTIIPMPQFHSIIPCEVLLYIEVTFLGFIH